MGNKPKPTKYIVDETKRKRFPAPLFRTVVVHEINAVEVERYRERNGKLPAHVHVLNGARGE